MDPINRGGNAEGGMVGTWSKPVGAGKTMPESLITIKQAAPMLALSVATVYRLVESRKVPFFRIGGAIRFSAQALQNWLAKCERPPL